LILSATFPHKKAKIMPIIHPKQGRPFSVLTPELVEAEIKRMNAAKVGEYVIARRAKELGVNRTTLGFHLRGKNEGAKGGIMTWRQMVRYAIKLGNQGMYRPCAEMLSRAANLVREKTVLK
jgi:hypothetical protein